MTSGISRYATWYGKPLTGALRAGTSGATPRTRAAACGQVAILSSVASTASRNSVPSPGRCSSYHRAAFSSSVEASGSFRKGRFTSRPTAGRRARARPPTVRQQTHPPSHAWRVVQFHEPTPLQSPPDPSSLVHPGSQEVQRPHRRVPPWARPRLLEEVLALATSCGHSRPERCSPSSGCTRRPRERKAAASEPQRWAARGNSRTGRMLKG